MDVTSQCAMAGRKRPVLRVMGRAHLQNLVVAYDLDVKERRVGDRPVVALARAERLRVAAQEEATWL